ncbi:MAG: DNA cytosine methyltransferase [Caldisphaeraceae archaeon]|nr:DNA cytosine methyltransferase [Caldisphaeraceae archaeon]
MPVKILDLYSGMGGLSLGFVLALDNAKIIGLDNDGYAVEVYNKNLSVFNAESIEQDILEWKPEGNYDIIIGGVPCQPYSLANTRKKGEEHPLYPTFPRFFDVVLELKPKAFLMENVKGLTTRSRKALLETQLERAKPNYNIKYQVLNSAYYGVPQRRERLFVLGIRKDLGIVPSFPEPTHGKEEKATLAGKLYKWVTLREAIGDLLSIPPQGLVLQHERNPAIADNEVSVLTPEQITKIKEKRDDTKRHYAKMEFPDNLDKPSRTVSCDTIEGEKRETIIIPMTEHVMDDKMGTVDEHVATSRLIYNEEQLKRVLKFRKGKLDSLDEPSRVVKIDGRGGDKTNDAILVPITKHVPIIEEGRYRRLTVREVLRLQSFPDWWIFPSNVSTSRKYKLVGNAVPPALAYRLALEIGKLLGIKTRVPPREGEWKLPYFHRMFADFLDTG